MLKKAGSYRSRRFRNISTEVDFDGRLRVSGGYMVSAWLNGVATDRWIDAVHANDFTEMSDVITFDGLTAKAELRF